MNKERRTDARVPLNLPARYDGLSGALTTAAWDAWAAVVNAAGQAVVTRGKMSGTRRRFVVLYSC